MKYEAKKYESFKAYKDELKERGVIRMATGYADWNSKSVSGASEFHIPAVFSDETVDRYGDVILAESFNNSINRKNFFEGNNPLLWAHNMFVDFNNNVPIGNVIDPDYADHSFSGIADFRAAAVDEFANKIFQLYKMKTLNAFSVGFRPLELSFEPVKEGQDGPTFMKCELLEVSAVPIPANPSALAKSIAKGVINSDFVEQHFKRFVDQIVQNKTFFLPATYQNLDFFDGITFKILSKEADGEAVCSCKVHPKAVAAPKEEEQVEDLSVKVDEHEHNCRFCGTSSIIKYTSSKAANRETLSWEVAIVEEKEFLGLDTYLDFTCPDCGVSESEALELSF